MKRDKKIVTPDWALSGHQKPVTRREFMAAGIIPFAATLSLPRLAMATSACPEGLSGFVPFISVHLCGGASIASQCVPLDQNMQMLSSYNEIGLGTRPPVEFEFGSVPFAGSQSGSRLVSTFLLGLRNPMAATMAVAANANANSALSKTAFVNFLHRSKDDSPENKYNAGGILQAIGLSGKALPYLGGVSSLTGDMNHFAAVAGPQSLWVQNQAALSNAASLASTGTHPLATLTASRRVALTQLIQSFNQVQIGALTKSNSGAEAANIITCAGEKNVSLNSNANLDLVPSANLSALWANALGQNSSRNDSTGNDPGNIGLAMVYNVLNGNASTASLNFGGFDYHVANRSTGDLRDFEAGRTIGKILKVAEAMNKPIFIYVTTDGGQGSVVSSDVTAPWTVERGMSSAAYTLFFNPNGRPKTLNHQVGYYTQGQVADGTFVTGNSPERTTQAVMANYLEINGRLDLYSKFAVQGTLSPSDLDKVLRYTKINS